MNYFKEFKLTPFLPNFTAATLVGLNAIIGCIAAATIIFPGYLQNYLPLGVNLLLLSTIIFTVFNIFFGAHRFTVTNVTFPIIVIFGLIAGNVSAMLIQLGTPQQILPTVLAIFSLTTLIIGLTFLLGGIFKLGNIVRYAPYPIIGGFITSFSWLIIKGGVFEFIPDSIAVFNIWLHTDRPWILLTILCFAAIAVFVQRRYKNPLFFLPFVTFTIVLFYLVLFLGHIPYSQALAQGWLLKSYSGHAPIVHWLHFLPFINFTVFLQQLPLIAVALLIAIINLLLTTMSIEISLKKPMDVNKELSAIGWANLATGIAGGVAESPVTILTILRNKLGGLSQSVSLIIVLECLAMLLFGSKLLSYLPIFVTNGLLVYVGALVIAEWFYDGWFKLLRKDYFVMAMIFLAMLVAGLLKSIVFGIFIALILFAFDYSRTNTIRLILSGKNISSSLQRDPKTQTWLQQQGDQILYVKLQGYLFFGKINQLFENIRDIILKSQVRIRFLILDFTLITGVDSAILQYFEKFSQLAVDKKFTALFTNLSAEIRKRLQEINIAEGHPEIRVFDTYQTALHWCEDQLLQTSSSLFTPPGKLSAQLLVFLQQETYVQQLLPYLVRLEIAGGEIIFSQDDLAKELYFIEQGQVSILYRGEKNQTIKLHELGSGNIIGEMGFFSAAPRSASAVTDQFSVLYKLTTSALQTIEKENPVLAINISKFIINSLSNRLRYANTQVDILLR